MSTLDQVLADQTGYVEVCVRDVLEAALDQGGDAVGMGHQPTDGIMTQRGAGESGSPRPDLSLSTWLTIWADWLASGKDIEDTNRQLGAEDLRRAAERLRGDRDLSTQPSPESGSEETDNTLRIITRIEDGRRYTFFVSFDPSSVSEEGLRLLRETRPERTAYLPAGADKMPQPESGSGEEGEATFVVDGKRLDARGVNEHGVAMCQCKPFGPVHAWEPGEWCSSERVVPKPPTQPLRGSEVERLRRYENGYQEAIDRLQEAEKDRTDLRTHAEKAEARVQEAAEEFDRRAGQCFAKGKFKQGSCYENAAGYLRSQPSAEVAAPEEQLSVVLADQAASLNDDGMRAQLEALASRFSLPPHKEEGR
jgi:hypothetical protein